jgi:DNA-binding HxlR family transcriptional regulator
MFAPCFPSIITWVFRCKVKGVAARSYNQFCGLARALDVLGERWTLLIIRDLLPGPRRYGQLSNQLPGAGTDLITARLRTLEEHGLIERHEVGGVGGGVLYALTNEGESLRPIIESLAQVGLRWLPSPEAASEQLDLAWALTTARMALDPSRCPVGTMRFDTDERSFVVSNDGETVEFRYVDMGALPDVDVAVSGANIELLALVTGRCGLDDINSVAGRRSVASSWINAIRRALPAPIAR